jgi:hypothetical protein
MTIPMRGKLGELRPSLNGKISPAVPILKGRCEKIEIGGQAGKSAKFYKCGRLEGKGNKVLQITTVIEVFHRGELTEEGTVVKLF